MTYVTSIRRRISHSARGELFNPLVYPFLLVTFAYGLGFTVFRSADAVFASSLFTAMSSISPILTTVWGVLALVVIVVGFYVLVYDKPPIGKANCMLAWMLWLFAGFVYILTGGWLTLFSVTIPSLIFWTWQYFSLAKFKHQDDRDKATMERYNEGGYDDEDNPKDAKRAREDNRGVDTDDRDSRN